MHCEKTAIGKKNQIQQATNKKCNLSNKMGLILSITLRYNVMVFHNLFILAKILLLQHEHTTNNDINYKS